MSRTLVFWIAILLVVWNALKSNARLLDATASFSNRKDEKQRGPTVKHTDVLPRVSLVARESTHPTRLRRRGVTDIGNAIYSPLSYNILIRVGGIFFEVSLDTGSSDLWIISDQCQTSQCKPNPSYPLTTYNSPSFQTVNNNLTVFNVSFADSTRASGFVAEETVQIDSLKMLNQVIGLVNMTNVTLGPSISGVFGMGFSRLSQISGLVPDSSPFIPSLVQMGVLDYPLVGLSLTHNSSGTLSFGAIDKSVVPNASLISWLAVEPFEPLPGQNASSTPLYLDWTIPLSALVVNGTNIPLHSSFPGVTGNRPFSLLDVGFTGFSGPYEDVAAIFFQLGTIRQASPGIWAVPCDIEATMTFNFGGTNVTLQPADFLIGPTEGDPNLCLSWPVAQIPPENDGIDWHMGTPVLRTVYTVFSYGIAGKEPPLVGLYPLQNATNFTGDVGLLSSAFSSLSATVATTLPPVLLPTPSLTTSPYAFNTSVSPFPTLGQTSPVQSDDGNSSYTPLFTSVPDASPGVLLLKNASALPGIEAPVTVSTIVITDPFGATHTSTSTIEPIPTRILGLPPGTYSLNSSSSLLSKAELAWTFILTIALNSFITCLWT